MSPQCFLHFTDENARKRRVPIDVSPFFIGRLPENDLAINDASLSRRHAKIETRGNAVFVTDNQSQNGVFVNSERIRSTQTLADGDLLNLGGSCEMRLEISKPESVPNVANKEVDKSVPLVPQQTVRSSGIPKIFLLAPFAVIFIIVSAVLYLSASRGKRDQTKMANPINAEVTASQTPRFNDEDDEKPRRPTPKPSASREATAHHPAETPVANESVAPDVKISDEIEQTEKFALRFMRKIAINDPNPVLPQKYLSEVSKQLTALKSSSAFRSNRQNAKQNLAQIEPAAREQNVSATFLAAFALSKLGTSQGNVATTAKQLQIRRLALVLGTELANDSLLIVAAEAEKTEPNRMRDDLASLAKQSDLPPQSVRTVWFLYEKGKISPNTLQSIIRFIACGALLEADL